MSKRLTSWLRELFRPTRLAGLAPRTARFRPWLEPLEDRLAPATFTVTDPTDAAGTVSDLSAVANFLTGVGSGNAGDLRYCIAQADTTPGADEIVFSLPADSTIRLSQVLRPITDPAGLTIRGETATNLTISGDANASGANDAGDVRVFFVVGGTVSIQNLTVAGGRAQGGAGGAGTPGGGGGAGLGGGLLLDSGSVTLTGLVFDSNAAVGGAGGAGEDGRGGGGGGTGGDGGFSGGGGGFLGWGGDGDSGSGGGGGGFTGAGGAGGNSESNGNPGLDIGGGGSGETTPEGLGGAGALGGGAGGSDNLGGGGGGGGSAGFAPSSAGTDAVGEVGGDGGFGGGGGPNSSGGGTGGDYGGGGGSGGAGGFGGGGGGNVSAPGGAGGFGGGGGGNFYGLETPTAGIGGQFGGTGGTGTIISLPAGGGGAGLGGAIFVRSGSLTLIDSTFTNNTATGGAAGVGTAGSTPASGGEGAGGAVFVNTGGTVTVTGSAFSANTASFGGAVYNNDGMLRVTDGNFSGNSASSGGGAVWNTSTAEVTGTAFSDNSATQGGAVRNTGTLTVTGSTFSDNSSATFGGAIDNIRELTVIRSTFSGNTAGGGGGIRTINLNTQLTVIDSTFSGNSATSAFGGGGILIDNNATVVITGTILADSPAGGDLRIGSGTVSGSFNLVEDETGVGTLFTDSLSGDPLLAPLGFYGGPTPTHALRPGSPALDANDPTNTAADQRGIAPFGRRDIGAFESRGFILAATAGTSQSAIIGQPFAVPLTVHLASNDTGAPNQTDAVPVDGVAITFTAPASGASATLSTPNPATTNAAGDASVTATANLTLGGYTVTASTSAAGVTGGPFSFDLTNLAPSRLVSVLPTPAPAPVPVRSPELFVVPGDGPQVVTFTIRGSATTYRNQLCFVIVDDDQGSVNGLKPGDPGYAAAVLRGRRIVFDARSRRGARKRFLLWPGQRLLLVLVQNSTGQRALALNPENSLARPPRVFFALRGANPDSSEHLRWRPMVRGGKAFWWEDQTGGGDRDFNDLVVTINSRSAPLSR